MRNSDCTYIAIQEIDSNENRKLLAYLTGPDSGHKELADGSWKKKIISSRNRMNIEFKSDCLFVDKGFSANIYFTPFPNKECESWLDMNKKTFKSPKHPQTFWTSKNCSWLITVDHDYHVTLYFFELYVRIMTSYYCF